MCINEITLREIRNISRYFGLDYFDAPTGLVLHSGGRINGEYWLIKLNKSGRMVRKVMHQNHGRNGRSIPLPCNAEDLSSDIVRDYFHVQNEIDGEKDLKNICRYIYNHANARERLSKKQSSVLEALQQCCASTFTAHTAVV